MRNIVVPLVVVVVSLAVVGALYAGPGDGQSAASGDKAKPGCGMGMCGMGKGMAMCGVHMGGCCAMTRALTSGQVALAPTCRGLQAIVTDVSHQGDPNASVAIYAVGASQPVHVKAKRIWPGHFLVDGDLGDAKQLAVRVNRATVSEIVYFGLGRMHAGAMCKPTTAGHCTMMDSGACKTMGACKSK